MWLFNKSLTGLLSLKQYILQWQDYKKNEFDMTYTQAFMKNFLGASPDWYKLTIIAFLVINPILFFFVSPFLAGWLLVAEFISR